MTETEGVELVQAVSAPFMAGRSGEWPRVRAAFLAGKVCAACGGKDNLEAHHKKPFHLHPELELDDKNLICLCERSPQSCHYHFGHNALSWSCYNESVIDDAALFAKRRRDAKYE